MLHGQSSTLLIYTLTNIDGPHIVHGQQGDEENNKNYFKSEFYCWVCSLMYVYALQIKICLIYWQIGKSWEG